MNEMAEDIHDEINREVSREEFRKKFNFNLHEPGTVSVRRQRILLKQGDGITERGSDFLTRIKHTFNAPDPYVGWGLGLTEFQLNHRTKFTDLRRIRNLKAQMEHGDDIASIALRNMGLMFYYDEVALGEIPVNYLPSPALARLSARLDRKLLEYSIRTCSTTIEVAMPNVKTAIRASDLISPMAEKLAKETSSQREKYWATLTAITGKRPIPSIYHDFDGLYEAASCEGFLSDPRMSPHVVNISPEGTLRLDCFGNTRKTDPVMNWVKKVMDILSPALEESKP